MTRSLRVVIAAIVISLTNVASWGQEVETRTDPEKQRLVTSIYKARSVQAQTLAQILQKTFEREAGLEVSFDTVSNSVIMSAPEKKSGEMKRLLALLDRQEAQPQAKGPPQEGPVDAQPEPTRRSPERRQSRPAEEPFSTERVDSPRRGAEREIAEERPAKNDHIVYSPRTAPAQALAETLRNIFDREGRVRIIAEPVSNSLVISAPERLLAEVTRLLPELDRERQMLQFEVLLVDREVAAAAQGEDKSETGQTEPLAGTIDEVLKRVSAAEGKGSLTVLNRFSLSSVEGQKAMAQLGMRLPRITGTSITQRGRANAVTLENIGTMLQLTSRLQPDGVVVVDLEFEKSYPGGAEEATVILEDDRPGGGQPTTTAPIHSLIVRQTLELKPGEFKPLFVSRAQPLKGNSRAEQVLLVGVRGK